MTSWWPPRWVDHAPSLTQRLGQPLDVEECTTKPLDIKLLSDPTKYQQEEKVLLLCLIEGKTVEGVSVEWLVNDAVVDLAQEDYSCSQCSNDQAVFSSQVNVSQQQWQHGAEVSCRVSHPSLSEPQVLATSVFCVGEAEEVEGPWTGWVGGGGEDGGG